MDGQVGIRRRRLAVGILVGALAATGLLASAANADLSRKQIHFEKLCAAQPSGAPRFRVQNLTEGTATIVISDSIVPGAGNRSTTITLGPKRGTAAAKAAAADRKRERRDTKQYLAPASWPFARGSGKYVAHYTLKMPDGSVVTNKVAEYCKCSDGTTTTSRPTTSTSSSTTTTTAPPDTTTTTSTTLPPDTTTTTSTTSTTSSSTTSTSTTSTTVPFDP